MPPFFVGLFGGGGASPPAAPTLTAPTDDKEIYQGQIVPVSATTTDGDLDQIEWVLDPGTGGETVVATDTSSPYSTTWTVADSVAAGAHTMVARAWRGGLYTDSAPIDLNRFSPLQIANLEQWLRGDAGVTITGLGISTWADQSGNARDATQSTDADRPGVGGINGRATVIFDRANTEHFVNTARPAVSAWSLVLAGKLRSTAAGQFFELMNDSTNNVRVGIATSEATYKDVYFGDGGVNRRASDFGINANLFAAAIVWDGAAWTAYRDGAAKTITTAGALTGTDHRIGAFNAAGAAAADLELCEWVMVSRAITSTERARLRAHLQARWGTP